MRKTLSKSSKLWLERQHKDLFVKKSKQDGYRSRAAYKLLELQQKYKILRPGMKIIDLGAAPGSWSQVISQVIFSNNAKITSKLIAVDILPIDPIKNVDIIQGDFTDILTFDQIVKLVNGGNGIKADVVDPISNKADMLSGQVDFIGNKLDMVGNTVDLLSDKLDMVDNIVNLVSNEIDFIDNKADLLSNKLNIVGNAVNMVNNKVDLIGSDLAPNLSGIWAVDIPKSIHLCELAMQLVKLLLKPNGDFLVKMFNGAGVERYLSNLRKHFFKVIICKPKSSRIESREIYVLAKGYRLI